MKIVIDIDENVFTRLFDSGTEDYAIVNDDLFSIAKAIRNGTPISTEGDLISREALKRDICNYLASFMNGDVIGDIVKIIDNAPTVKSSKTDYLDGWDGEYYGEDC